MIACVEALLHRTDEGFELVRDEATMSMFLGNAPAMPYMLVLERRDQGHDDPRMRALRESERSRGLRASFGDAD